MHLRLENMQPERSNMRWPRAPVRLRGISTTQIKLCLRNSYAWYTETDGKDSCGRRFGMERRVVGGILEKSGLPAEGRGAPEEGGGGVG